ncbi:MAG: ribonuclease III [Patescibacteria group bacterium]
MLPNFNNAQLLETALTHRSALNERASKATESNERLEFLGDAVLELLATTFLYDAFPKESEGVLTAYRSALVKTTSLASVAQKLNLGAKILMSKGEEAGGGRENISLLADTFEAILGALYLDQGLQAVETFLKTHLFGDIERILAEKLYKDPKSELQEIVQADGLQTPAYQVIAEKGPDHDKIFTISITLDQEVIATGSGKSKQLAQQAAAEAALVEYAKGKKRSRS